MAITSQDIDVNHPTRGMRCRGNWDAHARKLSRLTVRTRSGKRINLALCAFCYLRLAPRARAGRAR